MDLKMYLLTSNILSQKDSSYKSRFCTKVRIPSKLVVQVYAWAKYKDVVSDMSGSSQSIETPCNSKVRLTELKDLCFKSTEKQPKMNVCNSNTKILKFQRRRYYFRL